MALIKPVSHPTYKSTTAHSTALFYDESTLFNVEKTVTFTTFKMGVIAATGLDKDALHIYVGVGVYLLCVIVLRPLIQKQSIRILIAIMIVTCLALLGEYLDNRQSIEASGVMGLSRNELGASIRDVINTCLLPYVLYALMQWTRVFQPSIAPSKLLKRR